MNCPICELKGKVMETRNAMRRYRCKAGHKWKTLETIELVYDNAYVLAQQIEAGKRIGGVLREIKEARLLRGGLTSNEKKAMVSVKKIDTRVHHVAGVATSKRLTLMEMLA